MNSNNIDQNRIDEHKLKLIRIGYRNVKYNKVDQIRI